MTDLTPLLNKVHCMDALELLKALPDASVNAIITDLPYGTTACSWDEIIPFEPMWAGVKRVLKPRGVFVTTASQPFTSKLVMSNLAWFKYDVIWRKTQATGHLNAQIAPMREHEEVLVFGSGGVNYYPQLSKKPAHNIRPVLPRANTAVYGAFDNNSPRIIPPDMTFPRSVMIFANPNHGEIGMHPTQKPLDLYKYLVLTYTQPGDTVLDFCAGSGTTAVAAATLNRQFIAGDTDAGYCAIARKRLETVTQDMFAVYGGFEAQP